MYCHLVATSSKSLFEAAAVKKNTFKEEGIHQTSHSAAVFAERLESAFASRCCAIFPVRIDDL